MLGTDPAGAPDALRARIGVMPQGGGAYPGVRAGEMLRLVAACSAHPLDPAWLLDVLGLDRVRAHPLQAALRRAAAAARAGLRRRRTPRAGLPRRADRGHGPAGATAGVGADRGAAPRRGGGAAHHAPHGGGRGARRRRRDHRPRARGGARQPGRADRRVRPAGAAVPGQARDGPHRSRRGAARRSTARPSRSRAATSCRAGSTPPCCPRSPRGARTRAPWPTTCRWPGAASRTCSWS